MKRVVFVLALIMGLAIAAAPLSAYQSNGRTIQFAGREWSVKAAPSWGPGPNAWSDSQESVWVDEAGKLHLKIRNINGVWHSAEVVSVDPATYGLYRFYVETPMHNLDMNVILGLFLYEDDGKEIDIEVARWGQAAGPNAQYVVQPYDRDGHREQYLLDWQGPAIFEFDWQPDTIRFRNLPGSDPATQFVIREWTFNQPGVPSPTPDIHIHMNLWLLNPPTVPANGQDIEVVIANLEAPGGSTNCDLTSVYATLDQVQAGLDAGNQQQVQAAIALAHAELDALSGCSGTPPLPTVVPPPTPAPLPTNTPVPPPPSDLPIVITNATDSMVYGQVSAAYCSADYKIALYGKTDIWYVQPFADGRRNISIDTATCTWQSGTHPWDQVAAHVVPANFDIPTTSLAGSCPALSGALGYYCYP
ncbi:MAG: glycoside hydrolase family 16 protein [Anaerolineae bacterium]|nr:glycoside hydrolase family 16 protein [Anaerolineae bacterium]